MIEVVASWEQPHVGNTTARAVSVSGIQVGDLLVVIQSTFTSAAPAVTILTPTDNTGANTWTVRGQTVWSTTYRSVIGISDCIVVSAPTTITLNIDKSTANSGVILRISGSTRVAFADQFNAANVAGTNPTSPSITCTGGNRLYVTGLTHDDALTSGVVVPSGYTLQQDDQDNVSAQLYSVGTRVAAAGAQAPVWTSPGADNNIVIGSYVEVEPLVAEMLADGAGGIWLLNDNADSSGKGNTLTPVSAPPTVASIIPELATDARNFDGSADTMWAADHASLDLGDVFTLEAVIQLDSLPGGAFSIFNKGAGGYQLAVDGVGDLILSRADTAALSESSVGLVADGTTVYHCVVTKNGATHKVYVNSIDVTFFLTDSTCVDTTGRLYIGARNDTGSEPFDGRIQAAAVYPTALSAARVEAHYAALGMPTQFTTDFPVLAAGNDGHGEYQHTSWPPSGGTYVDNSPGHIVPAKTLFGGTYYVPVAHMRVDTSAIPDDATILSAALKLYIDQVDNGDNFDLVGDYYDFGGTPTVAADWIETASPSIFAAVDLASISLNVVNTFALTNLTGINKAGFTGIRLTLSAGTPTGFNGVYIRDYGSGFAVPTLQVTYDTEPEEPLTTAYFIPRFRLY